MDASHIHQMLLAGWGSAFETARVAPLGDGDLVSHTSQSWRVDAPHGTFVAKVLASAAFRRRAPFAAIKLELLEHCRAAGVPVESIERTKSEAPHHSEGETTVELSRFAEGTSPGAAETRAWADAAIALRDALDRVPPSLCARLADIPILHLVEEKDPHRAREQGVRLAAKARHVDPSRLGIALEPLNRISDDWIARGVEDLSRPEAVVHGDLHRSHFLMSRNRVTAIVDFDNATLRPRAFDLAWLCDQAGTRSVIDAVVSRTGTTHRELASAMRALCVYAIPIIVDIAKDVLVRGDDRPVWSKYLRILDLDRKLRIFAALAPVTARAERE